MTDKIEIQRKAEKAKAKAAAALAKAGEQRPQPVEPMSRYVTKPHHKERYFEPENLHTQLNEVQTVVTQLMGMNLTPKLKKLMINTALYQVAHVSGGYKGRYRSQGVLNAAQNNRSEAIQLDHVRQRKNWIPRLNDGETVASLIESAFCCVVTRTEHENLKRFARHDGWERYRQASIQAFDMSEGPPFRVLP